MVKPHASSIVSNGSLEVKLDKLGQRGSHIREASPIRTNIPTLQGLTISSIGKRVRFSARRRAPIKVSRK